MARAPEPGTGSSFRLFCDPRCGPCRFFARVSQWVGGHRVRTVPYDEDEAHRALVGMDAATGFSYAHLVGARECVSGAAILSPLVGLTLGTTAERVVRSVGPLD